LYVLSQKAHEYIVVVIFYLPTILAHFLVQFFGMMEMTFTSKKIATKTAPPPPDRRDPRRQLGVLDNKWRLGNIIAVLQNTTNCTSCGEQK
jgi:hypothetical protein